MYMFRNKTTDETEEHVVSHKRLLEFLEENPHLERIYTSPAVVSGVGSALSKAGNGWNDLLKNIKKGSDSESTIKTK